jgi:hypothetical protein
MDPYQIQLMQQMGFGMNPGMFAPQSQGLFYDTLGKYPSPAYSPQPVDMSVLAPFNLNQFGGIGMAGNMLADAYLGPMFQRAGMMPMGNAATFLQAQREHQFRNMQSAVASNVAGQDAAGIYNTIRGAAAVAGQPFDAAQRNQARMLASQIASAGPMLGMVAPGLLDAITGPQGSVQAFAGQMMEANRYAIDPLTGRVGFGTEANTALTTELFDQMYGGDNYLQMNGIRAGGAGQLYRELQARGQLGLGPLRDRQLAAARAVQNNAGLDEALANAGISRTITDVSELSSTELNQLAQTDAVQQQMTSADASKIKDRLQGYSSSLAAMREIFGENGDPNAPIPKLISALESLTEGNIQKFDTNSLNTMVRDLQAMSQMSGLSLDQLALRQQNGVRTLDAVMGAGNGVYFSPTATNLAVAQGMGYGQLPGQQGFGALNRQAVEQSVQTQFARGMASESNNMFAALSIMERTSGFSGNEAGERLAKITEAARNGQTTYEYGGQTYQVPTRAREIRGLIEQGGANAMDVGDFNNMLSDRATLEREMAENPELQTIALNNQYNEIVSRQRNQVANRIASSDAIETATRGRSAGERNRISRSIANAGVNALQDLSLEDQQDPQKRQEAMVQAIKAQAAAENITLTDAQAQTLANATFGEADAVARATGFQGGNFELNQVLGRQATEQRNLNRERLESRAQMNESLSVLGPSQGGMNRFFDALRNQGDRAAAGGQADLQTLMLDFLGISNLDAQGQLLPEMQALAEDYAAIEAIDAQIANPDLSPEEREKLREKRAAMHEEFRAKALEVKEVADSTFETQRTEDVATAMSEELGFSVTTEQVEKLDEFQEEREKDREKNAKLAAKLGVTPEEFESYLNGTASPELEEKIKSQGDREDLEAGERLRVGDGPAARDLERGRMMNELGVESEEDFDAMMAAYNEQTGLDLGDMAGAGLGSIAAGLGIDLGSGADIAGLAGDLGDSETAKRNQQMLGGIFTRVGKMEGLEGENAIEKLDTLTDAYLAADEAGREQLAQKYGMSVEELDRMMGQTSFMNLGEEDVADMSADEQRDLVTGSLGEVQDRDIGKEQEDREEKTLKITGELVLDGPNGRTKASVAEGSGTLGGRQ